MKTYQVKFINKQGKTFNEYKITTYQEMDIAKMWQVEKSINKNLGEIRILDENNNVIDSILSIY